MELKLLKPRLALNKAFLKVKPSRPEIELFKSNLIRMIDTINESESEEFHKNEVSKFLQNTYYSTSHYINTKDRKDLVIHNGAAANSTVGVIIEAKKPTNKAEMLKANNLNTKAFQELILYYLRERITHKNLEIKHLIATNIYEWFVFDAHIFEKLFAQNKALVKQFIDFEEKRAGGGNTDFFYTQIAAPAIETIQQEVSFAYFDIRDYEKPLRNNNPKDDNLLIALYKLLSPQHLLKQPFANDSNSLDKAFYTELLHIIGLTETKEGGKKLIQRKPTADRNAGSLLENTIMQLDSHDKLARIPKLSQYGNNNQEQLFGVALELVITWINRVLFLKLLEAQLVAYNKGNKDFLFLNNDKIRDFDDLDKLFFRVLAKKPLDRDEKIQQLFGQVPYLNSSLFEPTELEHQTLFVSGLEDYVELPFLSSTVLKDATGKKVSKPLDTLQYLFGFLDAYNFSSEGSEEIQEDNKRLINASVLGLIFEKINGYKDGSFFTPGFITMYMCRETIRRAVVQKFNDAKGWNCKEFNELYDHIEDRTEANALINSLKLCDPAVGSGHFLVSALNELIALKSELRILQDREGKRLKEYTVQVENDELVVTDDDGQLFEYNPLSRESQRVQETLFHEKQTLIENCLFGVDINPNSVKICRLRLWIELLKNAYYRSSSEGMTSSHPLTNSRELETLPNIDINIKCGNSLISRYALDADLKQALRSSKYSIVSYRSAVDLYRNAENKEQKREMEKLIASIKSDFRSNIDHPFKKRISTVRGTVDNLATKINTAKQWGEKTDKKLIKEFETAVAKLDKLEKERDDIEANKIYENAFEWRFEFPEVLNDDGGFLGFDVVIGNPPYVFARENFDSSTKMYYTENYKTAQYQVNLFFLFIEKTISILRTKGDYSLIVPNSLLMVSSAQNLRKHILTETSLSQIINLMGYTFEGVNVETIIISGTNTKLIEHNSINIYSNEGTEFILNQTKSQFLFQQNKGSEFNVFSTTESDGITEKMVASSDILNDLVLIKAGLQAYESGKGVPKQSAQDVQNRIYDYNYKFDENTYEYLEGKDVSRYSLKWSGTYLRYGAHLAAPRTFDLFDGKKIIIREITGKYPTSVLATYTEDIYLFNRSNIVIIEKEMSNISLKYVLGILNSKLMSYYFLKNTAKSVRQMFPKIILEDLRKFPIINIPPADQQPIIEIVDRILVAKQANQDTTILESEIDQLVYGLYGLTEEEIKIVEGEK